MHSRWHESPPRSRLRRNNGQFGRWICHAVELALVLLSAPAWAANPRDRDDCDKRRGDAAIAVCSRVIDDPQETAHSRAIAYTKRGIAWRDKGDLDRAIADCDEAIRLDAKAPAYVDRAD
jgi:tetratricopeptide (TPR) repeat protein